MRGQILKRNDGDGFFIIACDGVNMPLCVRANVIQISDAGGEIANIDCGDIPLCVQVEPIEGEQLARIGHCRAVKRDRTVGRGESVGYADDGFGCAERFLIEHAVFRVKAGDLLDGVIFGWRGADDQAAVRVELNRIVESADIGRLNARLGKQAAVG